MTNMGPWDGPGEYPGSTPPVPTPVLPTPGTPPPCPVRRQLPDMLTRQDKRGRGAHIRRSTLFMSLDLRVLGYYRGL